LAEELRRGTWEKEKWHWSIDVKANESHTHTAITSGELEVQLH